MAEYKVIVTTSGLGSRLGELTNYTNKCLVRVADKPAISYIVEAYPEDVNIVVTLGHFGSHVKQFLTIAYPDRNFTFVEVDKYSGPGSSLAYSLLQCKDVIDSPFIFHASDTILAEYSPEYPNTNYVIGSRRSDNSQYRTLHVDGEQLLTINEKGEMYHNTTYIGVAGIQNYSEFFEQLQLVNTNTEASDVHAINSMLNTVKFSAKTINEYNWFDVGNTADLIKTRNAFSSSVDVLDKVDESIFFFEHFVIKFFSQASVSRDRVLRAELLGDLTPEITHSTENFYRYNKAQGEVFSKSVNANTFKNLLTWTKDNLWKELPSKDFKQTCNTFYVDKTRKRIDQYLSTNTESDYVNSCYVGTAHELFNKVDLDWLCEGSPVQFHGDFILDNIIETAEGFKLIDWRQDFGGGLEVGDIYYDLAKLNHNLTVNHDIVNRGLFGSSKDNSYILVNSKLKECEELLHQFIIENGLDLVKVKVLTAIIWINMAPLHEYPFNNFLFNYGKYTLRNQLNKQQ